MAKPTRCLGVAAATSALLAETVPVTKPCRARMMINCSAVCVKPIKAMVMAPPKSARMIIFLRPKRSATAPQNGAVTIMVMPCTDMTSPAANSVLKPVELPNASICSGKKGNIIEKPTADRICTRKTTLNVNCQLCGSAKPRVSVCAFADRTLAITYQPVGIRG